MQDFDGVLDTVQEVIFLCEFRDSEALTLYLTKVPELRNDAKECGIKVPRNSKKPDLIDLIVKHRCPCLSGNSNPL